MLCIGLAFLAALAVVFRSSGDVGIRRVESGEEVEADPNPVLDIRRLRAEH
jgi:hypothetical protein